MPKTHLNIYCDFDLSFPTVQISDNIISHDVVRTAAPYHRSCYGSEVLIFQIKGGVKTALLCRGGAELQGRDKLLEKAATVQPLFPSRLILIGSRMPS